MKAGVNALSLAGLKDSVLSAVAARMSAVARRTKAQALVDGATVLELRRGMTGQEVRRLQMRLNAPLVDGVFGKGTEDLVKVAQRAIRLEPTGIVDRELQFSLGMPIILGVDISHWQGEVDFENLRKRGVRFVGLKAGAEKGGVAKRFRENAKAAKAAGLPRMPYQFANPHESPGWNRANLMSACGTHYPMELPPVYDLEDREFKNPKKLLHHTLDTLGELQDATGMRSTIYSSYSFMCGHLAGSRDPRKWSEDFRRLPEVADLWIVRYNGKSDPGPLAAYDVADDIRNRGWTFWQWSNRGVQAAGLTDCVESKGLDVNWVVGEKFFKMLSASATTKLEQ